MTTEDIFKYNVLCAKFLGWKETTEEFKIDWVGCKTKERLNMIEKDYIPILEKNGILIFPDFIPINFHNDWNGIMEVVEAINKTQNPVKQTGDTTHSTLKQEIQILLGKTAKEAVIKAIYNFLIWYDKNNGKLD